MTCKYPCGLCNNKIVSINNYSKEMGPIFCAIDNCGGEFILCEGEKITRYFRHKAENIDHEKYDEKFALESWKHKEMKKIIAENKKIPLRTCKWCKEKEKENLPNYTVWKEEQKWNEFRIDVIAYKSEKLFLIEIVNTHNCTPKKYQAFEDSKIDWMEINCDGKYLRGNYICDKCENSKINFGKKHPNKYIYEILNTDESYLLWVYLNIENMKKEIFDILNEIYGETYSRDRKLILKYNNIVKREVFGDENLLKEHKRLKDIFVSVYLGPAKSGVTPVRDWDVVFFGAHRGKSVYDIDRDYLNWMIGKPKDDSLKFFVLDAYLS